MNKRQHKKACKKLIANNPLVAMASYMYAALSPDNHKYFTSGACSVSNSISESVRQDEDD